MVAVAAVDGGKVHIGVYDGDTAGWHPQCGADGGRWFGCELAVTCLSCAAGIRPGRKLPGHLYIDDVLNVVEDIADELDRDLDDENRDRQALIEDAVRRLRALRGQAGVVRAP